MAARRIATNHANNGFIAGLEKLRERKANTKARIALSQWAVAN